MSSSDGRDPRAPPSAAPAPPLALMSRSCDSTVDTMPTSGSNMARSHADSNDRLRSTPAIAPLINVSTHVRACFRASALPVSGRIGKGRLLTELKEEDCCGTAADIDGEGLKSAAMGTLAPDAAGT